MPETVRKESIERLVQAERRGLRLAIACRTAVIAAALTWYVGASLFSDYQPRLLGVLALVAYTGIGVAHLKVIGTRFDRRWLKYAIYAVDILGICALFAIIPISRSAEVPQIIAFRAYGIYYLFPLVVLSGLSLSWRLVLWSGCVAVVGWWAAFLDVVSRMDRTLSWSDVPPEATIADYQNIFLSIDFIGRGNRIEETGMLFAAALILALAVYRARNVFFAQVAAEADRETERRAREQIRDTLGRYVPAAIAQKLINDPDALKPQVRHGTALMLDIADFTPYAAGRDPVAVITSLGAFLADASDIVSAHEGIVISFTGDGLLASFNAPVELEAPERAAVAAARALRDLAATAGFRVRIGIASGDIAAGRIGSSRRQAFTIYGEIVNLAARLENLGKTLGVGIVMDRATRDALAPDDPVRDLGSHRLRGFDNPVDVFTLGDQPVSEPPSQSAPARA